ALVVAAGARAQDATPDPREVVVEGTSRIAPREVSRLIQSAPEADARTMERLLAGLGRKLEEAGLLEARIELDATSDPVRLVVTEGPFAHWDSIAVSVRGGVDAVAPPRVGGEFSEERFDRALARWVEEWADAGYPFAIATVESIRVESGAVRAGVRCDP